MCPVIQSHNRALRQFPIKHHGFEVTPMRTQNSKLKTLPVCENTLRLAGLSQSPQTEISYVSCHSVTFLQDKINRNFYIYIGSALLLPGTLPRREAVQCLHRSEETALVHHSSKRLYRLSGSLGIVSDFSGSHILQKLGTLLCAFMPSVMLFTFE